ncbi:hypothetical protein LX36DRAFT_432738 [Colletotrichum falcatum]|nr:hypothetical protein LX36DRAFT_432738 [Colletotrichum falcatum]
MPKDRTERRNGPQVEGQPAIDTSILYGGRAETERERALENKQGVPRDVAGKTPGGRDRHHCPQGAHSSDIVCLKKGCMVKCATCGIHISRYSGAKCRACAARKTGRLREEKQARQAQRKLDAKLARSGKSPKAKSFLAPQASGIRKRAGRVGVRALARGSSRRSRGHGRRFSSPRLSGEESVDSGYDEMSEDECEWEDAEGDVDSQDDETAAREAHYMQLLEEEAALQRKIRESLLNLLS